MRRDSPLQRLKRHVGRRGTCCNIFLWPISLHADSQGPEFCVDSRVAQWSPPPKTRPENKKRTRSTGDGRGAGPRIVKLLEKQRPPDNLLYDFYDALKGHHWQNKLFQLNDTFNLFNGKHHFQTIQWKAIEPWGAELASFESPCALLARRLPLSFHDNVALDACQRLGPL